VEVRPERVSRRPDATEPRSGADPLPAMDEDSRKVRVHRVHVVAVPDDD
jgi:hypothetical protein